MKLKPLAQIVSCECMFNPLTLPSCYIQYTWEGPNSAGPDKMQHYAAFHLSLHYLQKYWFRVFLNTKG